MKKQGVAVHVRYIFDYFNHIAALIMAQFYGHYTIEVLTIFA